jgi:aminoglycoside 3-N-acetyltransferase
MARAEMLRYIGGNRMNLASLKPLKQRIKRVLRRAKSTYVNRFHRFTPEDLGRTLKALGLAPGDAVLTHSSFDRFEGFAGGVGDAIRVLKESVGDHGTLLMPTMTFTGSAVDYARAAAITDLQATPSRNGLITEIFRRMPGVTRSVHPTHPVAVFGSLAEEFVRDHHHAGTPCGRPSPFMQLLDHKGKILFLGVDIQSMTLFHALEELLEGDMPFSPFTKEVFELRTRNREGQVVVTKTRLYDRSLSSKRDTEIMMPILKANGWWKESRVGLLPVILLEAQHVWGAVRLLAQQGIYCYRTS